MAAPAEFQTCGTSSESAFPPGWSLQRPALEEVNSLSTILLLPSSFYSDMSGHYSDSLINADVIVNIAVNKIGCIAADAGNIPNGLCETSVSVRGSSNTSSSYVLKKTLTGQRANPAENEVCVELIK